MFLPMNHMSRICRVVFITLLLGISTNVWSQTAYINDHLRVGLRPSPDNDVTPIAVVVTGDKLEILDRDDAYVLVRTESGTEGWIKEIYTTREIPAIVQLRSLKKTTGGTSARIQELNKQVLLMENANKALTEELEEARSERNKYYTQVLSMNHGEQGNGWLVWLISILVFTIASFIMGMYWYRNQAMKRLGGLRIYF